MDATYKVGNVVAIGEPASGPACGVVNPIRGRVGTSSRGQVVIVPIINQRISKHKEGSSCLGRTKPNICHRHGQTKNQQQPCWCEQGVGH